MSIRFNDFLKKLPQKERELYLTIRLYEQSCDSIGCMSEMMEKQILEKISPQKHNFVKKLPSVLSEIEKLDKEFDEKLGKWVDSSSSEDDSD